MRSTLRHRHVLTLLAVLLIASQWLSSHHVHDLAEPQQSHLECSSCTHRSIADTALPLIALTFQSISFKTPEYSHLDNKSIALQCNVVYLSRAPPSYPA